MKLATKAFVGLAVLAMSGCSTWQNMTRSEQGTAIGAAIGGAAGAAVSGGLLAPAGAAMAGGLLGYKLGEDDDQVAAKKAAAATGNRGDAAYSRR